MLIYRDNDSGLQVKVWFDRWDALQSNRARWHYQIEAVHDTGPTELVAQVLHHGDDLTTVDDECSEIRAMGAFSSFFDAWLESVAHEVRTGDESENFDLFPRTLLEQVSTGPLYELSESLAMEFSLEDIGR